MGGKEADHLEIFIMQFQGRQEPPVSHALPKTAMLVTLLIYSSVAIVVLAKYQRMSPSAGDLGVWNEVIAFISQGALLYEDVWDHKDPGYFAVAIAFERVFANHWPLFLQLSV